MCGVDVGSTRAQIRWQLDGKVLIRRKIEFVVFGVERANVKDSPHSFIRGEALGGGTGIDSNGDSHLF